MSNNAAVDADLAVFDDASRSSGALEGIVVLDLAGAIGNYCSKLFADLGADVILVEPLCGTATRHMPPRIKGRSDVEASLLFKYNNTNKRSIALDLERPEGQEIFRSIAARAQLVIETERPGVMEARGLGYQSLRNVSPHIVLTSITPFGQSGPYSQWEAEDIVGLAMGGMLYLGGYTDTPPLAAFGYQAFAAANCFAAVASMAAVYEAEISGAGQHVDVSMQECVVMGMENSIQFYELEGTIRRRWAGQQRLAGTGVFKCKDGHIYLVASGVSKTRFWDVTADWLIKEGVEGAEIFKDSRWSNQDYFVTDEAKAIFENVFSRFAEKETKMALYTRGQQNQVPIAPVLDSADIVQSTQLNSRRFFVAAPGVDHLPEEEPPVMPGAPYILSATPWSLRCPAPRLGEHTSEILDSLGIPKEQQAILREKGIVR